MKDSVSCSTLCRIWSVSTHACSTERRRGQKEGSRCANSTVCQWDVAQCERLFRQVFPSCLAVLTEVHMPPSRQPLYLCLSVHLAVGLIRIAAETADRPSAFSLLLLQKLHINSSTWNVTTECTSGYQAQKSALKLINVGQLGGNMNYLTISCLH